MRILARFWATAITLRRDRGVTKSVFKSVLKSVLKSLLRFLPRTRMFDFLHSLIFFIYAQKRIPRRNSGLFNDYMFYLRNSGDMADALRQITSSKVYAKFFIDQVVGRKVTPETYAVFTSVEDIRRSELPDRCVLKPAHAAGAVVFLEGSDAEISEADYEKLRRALAFDVYTETREINYKNLRKQIICEELIDDAATIKDYKLFYYNGKLKFIQVNAGRHGVLDFNFYDNQWNRINVTYNNCPTGEWEIIPDNFGLMCEIAGKIAQHFESARIDLYTKGDRVYVGEITHCHNQGNGIFGSIEQERTISQVFFD
jgi:hypothetical protein